MDFYPGGELFYHMQMRKKFKEEAIKMYMGESSFLALNYLHKNNIIYRDLKPENILVDIDGHLHLTDYGLCKFVQDKHDLNYTFCGSPEYIAPELIKKTGYNFTVDFYTLGILIYEMSVGHPPFLARDQKDLFRRIVYDDIEFPSHLSSKLKSFISQLLNKNPKERLGAKDGLSEIVNHPWCKTIDFVSIVAKKKKGPIIPELYKTNFYQ
eukprot:CAMPEP_0114602052 /NCGR_PEP_ID=MMETSP0125-20121206/24682_1 /TAXON_ID=485358 ORGANISM="Aristerostoma sp., Strain ATCC 50986" /NCGR_SAMPLE_ID=MMETSP0125 /ASSEMBLY_ACC=CAM_ASM_000245 /LENGTH=209 /DNA_ID=CAMNT_0001811917 /DNA_START=754 /DNA_END=1384 /DNA_ORIENTATION=-